MTTSQRNELPNSELVHMASVSAESCPSEPRSSESVQSDPTSTQPISSHLIQSDSVSSELVHSEVNHPETVGSDLVQPDKSEVVNPQTIDTELSRSQVMSSNPVHAEEMDSEATQPTPVRSEATQSEVTDVGLVIHSQPASAEPVDSEQSELTDLRPIKTESVHSEPESTVGGTVNLDPGSTLAETLQPETDRAVAGSVHSDSASTVPEWVHPDPRSPNLNLSQPATEDSNKTELMGSEMIPSEPVSAEPLNVERTDSQLDNPQLGHTEPSDPQPVNPEMMSVDPMNSDDLHLEPVNRTPGDIPMSSDLVNSQLVSSEMIAYQQDTGSQQVYDRVSSEPVHLQETSSDPVHIELSLESDDAEMEVSEPVHSERVHSAQTVQDQVFSEPVHSRPASEEQVHSQQINEQHVHSLPISTMQGHSRPVSTEHGYSQHVSSEPGHEQQFHSEPMDMEFINSELSNSQADNTEAANSQSIKAVRVGASPVSSQHSHSESFGDGFMSTQPMIAEPVSLGLAHPQPIGPDLVYSQSFSSELMHSQALSSEMIHLQQVNSEMIHSQQVNSELIHSEQGLIHPHEAGAELVPLQSISPEMIHSQSTTYEPAHLLPPGSVQVNLPVISDPSNVETQPNKRRKKKSIVWEHFTIETVGAGCRRACCKVCKQSFAYSTGSKVAGTSHLKRHIAKGTCPVILRQQEKSQLSPYMPKNSATESVPEPLKRRYRGSNSPYLIFDQDRCRHEIARMIIMHEYPLHMVEHPGFVAFVQNLQPRFDMVNFNTVQGDCVATYLREKQKLQRFIDGLPGRICLSLDLWTSNQTTNYIFLTGIFIDNDWKLHRRLLNVVMEPFPESDSALGHAVATCLSYWNLENRLFAITVHHPLTEPGIENLRALISVKNSRILHGQLLITNCLARAFSGMAQELLVTAQDTVRKIRASVTYVKTSESHEEKFLVVKQQLQVPTEKSLSLDNTTQWNTTYEMLLAAAELKEVFSCLDASDPEYKDAPSMEDWQRVESLCAQLKLIYDRASLLTGKVHLPSNEFFNELWHMQLDLARASASDDPFVRSLAKPLRENFQKYWRDCSLILALAVAMDPRFKMKLVEFTFTRIFGEQAPAYIRVVDEGIHELFVEYMTLPLPPPPAYAEDGYSANPKMEESNGGSLISSNGLSDFDMYIMETSSQQSKSELDQYLEESLLLRVPGFDVLGWWKLNKLKYPTLSKMARDILAVPPSSVGPESVFDIGNKEMDQYRSSLRPETMEALICAKDWLQHEPSQQSNPTVKTEP